MMSLITYSALALTLSLVSDPDPCPQLDKAQCQKFGFQLCCGWVNDTEPFGCKHVYNPNDPNCAKTVSEHTPLVVHTERLTQIEDVKSSTGKASTSVTHLNDPVGPCPQMDKAQCLKFSFDYCCG